MSRGPDRGFAALLIAAVALTVVLSGLVIADVRATRGSSTSTSTVVSAAGEDTAAAAGIASPRTDAVAAAGAPTGSAGTGGGGTPAAHPVAAAPGAQAAGQGTTSGAPAQGAPCADCLAPGAVIPLGSIVTQTGPGRSISMAHAIAAWEQDVNRRGGINGHRLSLDLRDDGGNGDTGAGLYRTLDAEEHVLAMVGECAPITDAQQVGYVNAHGLPVVGECQSADAAYTSSWVWVGGPTPYQNGQLAARLAITTQGWPTGQGKVALVCLDQAAVASTCKGAEDYYGDASLWSGHPQKEEIADSNYPQLIAQWRSDGVTDVHLVLEPGNTTRYLAAARDASWSVPTFENLAIDDSVAGSYANAEGMLIGTPWTPLDQATPGMQRLTSVLQTYYPDDRVDIYAQTGWIGCLILEHAIELMGQNGISRERLQQTLNALRSWDTGLGPTVSYSASQHVGDVESSLMALHGAGGGGWHLDRVHGPIGLR